MARPRHDHPTPAELEVLQVLWERGPSLVRDVMGELNERRPRAYTTVMSLLNVMTDKGLLRRKTQGRAFVYSAKFDRDGTTGGIVRDLVERAFDGSADALIARLLDQTNPDRAELEQIRKTISAYKKRKGRA